MGIQTQEKLLQECYLMVMSFLKEKKLEDFWEPVKWQELGLYDYLEKIKTPMDLTTMKNKFESNQYRDIFEFAFDMRLMWQNCLTYNQEGCIVVDIAKKYQHVFEERFTKILNSNVSELAFGSVFSVTCRNVQNVFKRNLFKEIAKLDHEKVSTIVQMIWQFCPEAISDSNETLNIDVDHISKYAYYMIQSYINSLSTPSEGAKWVVS